jgi:hypothetical protein
MGEIHEERLAAVNDGKKTRGSGSQWAEQADGRNHHDLPFAFRWDGKSTKGRQVAVTLDMIRKIRDQAHGERPQLGLLWFGNEALTSVLESWIAVPEEDWGELLPAARAWALLSAEMRDVTPNAVIDLLMNHAEHKQLIGVLQKDLADLREHAPDTTGLVPVGQLGSLREHLAEVTAERDRYKAQAEMGSLQDKPAVPGFVPRLPWTVIHIVGTHGAVRNGIYYDPDGYQHSFSVGEVRVERSMMNRPKMMVNNNQVRDGDLYMDGVLQVRSSSDPAITEKG